MERESFEDEEVAKILNEDFISIKVDREERPDVDHIYMMVCQSMTGHGGWPLTVIMTPDKKPFFSGTYFPKSSRGGIPGIMDILSHISDMWKNQRDKILQSSDEISVAIKSHLAVSNPGELSKDILHQTYQQIERNFDALFGGFSSAPKFPTPHILGFLLRYWKISGEENALKMVEKTLDSMFQGGIYDHIGYGFARYSTDRKWLVPHFEKMLYDNALLTIAYLETYQATGNINYANIAKEILAYIQRDMTSPDGAFYSAEDADSEGVEGKFYVWTADEIKEILGEEAGQDFCNFYDITPQGNFEGHNIPNLIGKEQVMEDKIRYEKYRQQLFDIREKRIHPHKDDKILTSWNGLMITAMALAARVLNEPSYSAAAEKAANFILKKLQRKDGRLLARYRDGESAYLGYIDDYAFFTWGLIELYQATFNPTHLQEALNLTQGLLDHFWDVENGGLYLYGDDGEQLIARPKEVYDGATPSGNSVAALNFLRLAQLTGKMDLEEKAVQIIEAFGGKIANYPAGYTHFLMAVQFTNSAAKKVIIAGDPANNDTQAMLITINKDFLPHTVTLLTTPGIEKIVPYIKEYKTEDKATAYVCQGYSCQTPTTDIEEMMQKLRM